MAYDKMDNITLDLIYDKRDLIIENAVDDVICAEKDLIFESTNEVDHFVDMYIDECDDMNSSFVRKLDSLRENSSLEDDIAAFIDSNIGECEEDEFDDETDIEMLNDEDDYEEFEDTIDDYDDLDDIVDLDPDIDEIDILMDET